MKAGIPNDAIRGYNMHIQCQTEVNRHHDCYDCRAFHNSKGNEMTKTATVHAQQKWEYMELTRKTEAFLVTDMNGVGQHGWELVFITCGKDRRGDNTLTAFLKRPYVAHSDTHDELHPSH